MVTGTAGAGLATVVSGLTATGAHAACLTSTAVRAAGEGTTVAVVVGVAVVTGFAFTGGLGAAGGGPVRGEYVGLCRDEFDTRT